MNNFATKYQIKYKAAVLKELLSVYDKFWKREDVLWRNVECSQWDRSVQHWKGTKFMGSIQPKDEHKL